MTMEHSPNRAPQKNRTAKHFTQRCRCIVKHVKQWLSYGLIPLFSLFLLASESWAVSCDTFPLTDNNYCRCTSSFDVLIGYWYSNGTIGNNTALNANLCTDANDSVCATPAGGSVSIGAVIDGQELYFANTSAAPNEYFKCTYNAVPGNFTTTAHSPFAVGASVSSVGGLIFLAASFLFIGIWASRRQAQKSD